MAELRCPHCGQAFTVDNTELSSIIKQIRDKEFESELTGRTEQLRLHLEEKHRLEMQTKELRVREETRGSNEAELKKLEAINDELKSELNASREELGRLNAAVNAGEDKKRIAVMEAVQEAEEKRRALEHDLISQKERYELQLQEKQTQIELYRDMKVRMSTKMVGESLEQHCETEFNRIRMTAFPNAYFEKDNDASRGSKGDYIYREYDENGVELISIMFEMKNEMETTATKHRNEDFLKELDKDRREKKCEYAVLVSMLEMDSDLYNGGIVDVSYRYDKMYVVRPQCFVPIITILRNAAFKSLEIKQELELVREQNVDITNFEDNLLKFKNDFGNNYRIAHDHFDKAIDEIDKTIDHLQKVKKELMGSDRQLGIATGKVENITIKKLTKDNPTMREKFEEISKSREENAKNK